MRWVDGGGGGRWGSLPAPLRGVMVMLLMEVAKTFGKARMAVGVKVYMAV